MRFLVFLFVFPLYALLQVEDALTNQRVIQLVQRGASAVEVLRAISTAPAVSFHLTPTDTDELMRAGVSEQTIKAMSARERGLVFRVDQNLTVESVEPHTVVADRTTAEEGKANDLPAVNTERVPTRISIVVVDGEGATSAVRQRAVRDPLVMIEDDDHRPVTGAVVAFGLPISGTSGEFSNGIKSLTVLTDNRGQAVAYGLKANDVPGTFQISVAASYHALQARTLINQRVEGRSGGKGGEVHTSKSSNTWKWVLVGVVAAGGAVAGIHYGTGTSSNSPVSISAGAVAVGGPR